MSLCKGEEGGKEGGKRREGGKEEGGGEEGWGGGEEREGVSGMVQSASTNMPTLAHMTRTEENAQLHWYAIPQHTHS